MDARLRGHDAGYYSNARAPVLRPVASLPARMAGRIQAPAPWTPALLAVPHVLWERVPAGAVWLLVPAAPSIPFQTMA